MVRRAAADLVDGVGAPPLDGGPQILGADLVVERRQRPAVDAPAVGLAFVHEVQQEPVDGWRRQPGLPKPGAKRLAIVRDVGSGTERLHDGGDLASRGARRGRHVEQREVPERGRFERGRAQRHAAAERVPDQRPRRRGVERARRVERVVGDARKVRPRRQRR